MIVTKFGYVNFIGRVDLEYDGNWNIDGVDSTHETIKLLAIHERGLLNFKLKLIKIII